MNHHRLGITALILLIILSGFFIYTQLLPQESSPFPIPQLAFDGTIPREITRGDTSKKQIIFTFDGGDGKQSATAILDALKNHHVKSTFFLTGKWALRNSGLVKQMIDGGHEIFNHSYDHPHLTEFGDEQIRAELLNMDGVLIQLAGTSTKPYFRPPYGDRDVRVLKTASSVGFRSVYWTIDAHDWMEIEGITADEVKNRILSNLEPGMIVLMHIGDTITGTILDDVFTKIERQGYNIVSLTQGI